jgi:8-oxo-dGTP diphosphatase
MSLVRVFVPQTLSEATVVTAMLEAHEIPVLRHNGNLAGLLPGVQINAYNTQSIMVPEEHAADALELLADFRHPPRLPPPPRSIARMIFEGLFFGWFVPGSRPREAPRAPVPARFIALHEVNEEHHAQIAELSFAVIIARASPGVVLVFNRYRKVWELPGGLIDAGEMPRAAAIRELMEEAGCVGNDVAWLALMEVDDGSRHHGAVFECKVDVVPDSVENEEIAGIAYWQPARHPQPLGEADLELLRRFG